MTILLDGARPTGSKPRRRADCALFFVAPWQIQLECVRRNCDLYQMVNN